MPESKPPQSNEEILLRLKQLQDRAYSVTDDRLTIERTESELIGALRRVTKLQNAEIDAIQARIDERATRGEIANIDCAKGCWSCCAQMVAVTIPEVLRLAGHIRSTFDSEQRADLDRRMAGYMEATAAWHAGDRSKKPRYACPLLRLSDGTCGVWMDRPIVCRGQNSTDHNACITKRDDPVGDPAVPQIMGQLYTAMFSRTGMRRALEKHGLDGRLYEMTPALIIALEREDAAERYFAGEAIFESARIPEADIEASRDRSTNAWQDAKPKP